MSDKKPLLTLAICCYKFERFVREALEGAFAQTYRPLEIVISDDCSPDNTWNVILETVAAHFPSLTLDHNSNTQTHNPTNTLSLVLNRNPTNLGLALHENRLFELSHGEWIAFQSGDDVSTADRVVKIYETVVTNPNIRCLHCATSLIGATGEKFVVDPSFRKTASGKGAGLPSVLGAGAVYHRDVYHAFGPLGAEVAHEDNVLPLRAALLGGIAYINEPLVRYRKHGENASGCFSINQEAAAKYRLRLLYARYQGLVDLHTAELKGIGNRGQIRVYRQLIENDIFVQYFLGHWRLSPDWRWRLLLGLIGSPRMLGLFVRRAMHRIMP